MKAIIPCAGFGTRMGMETTQSKELLLDPSTNDPLLKYHLNICKNYDLKPVIVTRKEKTDLIHYCAVEGLECLVIDAKREWPYTVFMSYPKWGDNNIMLLPDSKFEPHNIINNIKEDLYLGSDISLAVHPVSNPDKWCVVNNYKLVEKSKELTGFHYAFGIIGFKRSTGLSLFNGLDLKKEAELRNTSFQYLMEFKDITRTGVVE